MKHPASTATLLLLGLAFLVGGATWLLSGADADTGQAAQVPATAASSEVGFVAVTPREQHKQMNMERTQRELKRIREVGQEVAPDLYMIPDGDGDPTFYSTKLIKGVGRNGEPLFVSAQIKKTRTVPLRDPKKYLAPEAPKFKKKPIKGLLKGGKPDGDDSDSAGIDADSGSSDSGAGQTGKGG